MNPAIALLLLLDLDLGMRLRFPQSKIHCVECSEKIPPGRAGRKCETCRNKTPLVVDNTGKTPQLSQVAYGTSSGHSATHY